MKYLFSGTMSVEKAETLISLTNIRSDAVIGCVIGYLCNGHSEALAIVGSGVDKGNFNKAMKKLNEVAEKIEKYKSIK